MEFKLFWECTEGLGVEEKTTSAGREGGTGVQGKCGFKDHGHYGLFMEIKIQNIFIAEQLRGFGKITLMILEIL